MSTKSKINSVLFGASLCLAFFSGCATTPPVINTHPDTAVDFSNYKSFLMMKPLVSPARNPAITPSLVRDLRDEAAAAFAAKGLTKSTDYSDALVLIHGGLQDKLEIDDFGRFYGPRGRGFGRQELDAYKEGSVYVDVFDAKSHELIWRGSAVAPVSGVPETAKLKETINTIISRYPN